jgi:hypothetical protein
LLAAPNDRKYGDLVKEVRDEGKFRFFGQLIVDNMEKANPRLKDELRQNRLAKPHPPVVYNWINGKYDVSELLPIEIPVLRKIGARPPDLTVEILRYFSGKCYACGMAGCPGKKSPECVYHSKPDAWNICSLCKTGFHLSRDCLAALKN